MRGASQGSSCSRPTCQKRWAIALRSASGSPRNQPRVRAGLGQQLVDEGPVGLRERRRVVAVDEVDPLRARLGQQRGPLERALAPAEDQHAAAGEARRSRPCVTVWDHCSGARRSVHERRLDGEGGDAGRGDDPVGARIGRAVRRGGPVEPPRRLCRGCSTRRGSGSIPSCSANQSAYAMNVSTGIGSSSHPPVNASNVCTPAASRCHSRPDRSSIPSGMLRRQNRIGSPTTVTDSPRRRASAATARPYGPAPMTSSSMRRRILAACD